jgi:uncharacterized protein YoxC
MKQDFLLKTALLIIAIVVIVGGWFCLQTIDEQSSKIEKLEETIQRQHGQISFLENANRQKTQEFQESEHKKIEEAVNVFVQSVYHVQQEHFEERRANAKTVLTQDLFEKIFPADEPLKNLLYEYDLGDVRVYTLYDGKHASAFVIFNQAIKNLANNDENENRMTIEIFLQKEGENWLVNDFEQINAEPL